MTSLHRHALLYDMCTVSILMSFVFMRNPSYVLLEAKITFRIVQCPNNEHPPARRMIFLPSPEKPNADIFIGLFDSMLGFGARSFLEHSRAYCDSGSLQFQIAPEVKADSHHMSSTLHQHSSNTVALSRFDTLLVIT
jgi:hypothetical protein